MLSILFFIFLLTLSYYAFQALKNISRSKWTYWTYWIVCLGILINFFIRFWIYDRHEVLEGPKAYSFGIVLSMAAAQLVLVLFLFGEDLQRFIKLLIEKRKKSSKRKFLPSRRKFVSQMALGIAAIPFSSMMFGMFDGKYNFKVFRYELEFDDLPDAFDGYKIVQLSDIHCGSFDNYHKVAQGVELVKEQQADAVMFTGDLVNNLSDELEDWKELFGSITAPDGVFSVLGNHDYGDYYKWDHPEEKTANFEKMIEMQSEMGWDLLLNESRRIERDGQFLHIVGVENWGNGRFPRYGNEEKAGRNLTAEDFKILLSHDPSHWQEKIQENERNYQLTLSGHTHGMQFGIDIPGVVKWSPIQYRYKYWAGVYQEHGRYLHVNRGFGYLGYPGRVGMWPEITVLKLRKKQA